MEASARSDGGNLCPPGQEKLSRFWSGKTPGGQIVSAPLVENYPGILSISGAELAQKMTEQAKLLGAEFLFTEATGLSKAQNGFLVSCADGALEARTVILATGASHRKLGLSQEDALTGCGISYCAVCRRRVL